MLSLFVGAGDWEQESDKTFRSQRSKSSRTTRPDADADLGEHAEDWGAITAHNSRWRAGVHQTGSLAIVHLIAASVALPPVCESALPQNPIAQQHRFTSPVAGRAPPLC